MLGFTKNMKRWYGQIRKHHWFRELQGQEMENSVQNSAYGYLANCLLSLEGAAISGSHGLLGIKYIVLDTSI